MTFSSEVKSELCALPVEKECCAVAEAYGVLLYGNTFSPREIRLITGNRDFSERLPHLFKLAFGLEVPAPSEPLRRGAKRSFVITDHEWIKLIFSRCGFDVDGTIQHHINLAVLEDECCCRSFMRGAFLAGGSVNNPTGRCHLEIVTAHMSVGRESRSVLQELGISPRDTQRNGSYITYLKQGELIEVFLNAIGARAAASRAMAARLNKEIIGDVNRRVNCDTANADKTVNAALRQLDAIRSIERDLGLESLPSHLYEAALLRIVNPEASLADMASLADPPVSRSSMSHRLRRLVAIAESS